MVNTREKEKKTKCASLKCASLNWYLERLILNCNRSVLSVLVWCDKSPNSLSPL